MPALIDEYTDEEFKVIVETSNSMLEISSKLGYSATSGDSFARIRKRIDSMQLSTNHFNPSNKRHIRRNEESLFIENSTADQSTLRAWYKKGQYTEYICSICGQLPEWQGKPLTLILDHINGHNHDDRLENLRWVCPNCNQQLGTTGSKNRIKIQKKYFCLDCGSEITKKSTRCASCAAKMRPGKVEDKPSKEELKDMIRTMPFTKIASNYGVTDNAIRKWCDNYNLPRKATDIKRYSDEEWAKI